MFEGIELTQLQWLFIVGAGLAIGALALVIGQRAWHHPAEDATAKEQGEAKNPFLHGSPVEKRVAYRRKGKCVEVEISDEEAQQGPWYGWVMDRSMTGLRINVDRDIPSGTVLNVRVRNINPPMPWLAIRVAHSKSSAQGIEIGCEFVTPPTWNMLLLFG